MRYRTHRGSASDSRSEATPSRAGKRSEIAIKTPIVEAELPTSRFSQEAESHWKKKKKKKKSRRKKLRSHKPTRGSGKQDRD